MKGPLANLAQMCEVFDVTKELVSCRSRSELALSGTLGKNKKVRDRCMRDCDDEFDVAH